MLHLYSTASITDLIGTEDNSSLSNLPVSDFTAIMSHLHSKVIKAKRIDDNNINTIVIEKNVNKYNKLKLKIRVRR